MHLHVARERVDVARPMRERLGDEPVAAGRTAQAEIDAPGMEGIQRAELFGDGERARDSAA